MSDKLAAADLANLLRVPFTSEQLSAISAPHAPAVVIAGAGSGKTSVMSARVVWLIASGCAAPDQVLGLTFTNKAAAELNSRVHAALAAARGAGFALVEGEPTITTYHAYAGALLREHGLHAGLEPKSRLLADASRYQLAERVVRRASGPFEALKLRVPGLTQAVVALESELNEHLVDPREVAQHSRLLLEELTEVETQHGALKAGAQDARRAAQARIELIGLVEAFRIEKRRSDAVDFGDQMAGAALIAERFPEVVAAERRRYASVVLDEYQDTSITQKRLLLALFGHQFPVTAVGDPLQAIYGWRGASIRNITAFAHEFAGADHPATTYPLSQNNRSGERILQLANRIGQPLRKGHPGASALRPRPDQLGAGTIEVSLFDTFDEEVSAVCDGVQRQVAVGTRPRDIAVLCRNASSFSVFHEELTSRDIPVEVVGLGGLLDVAEVVDLVATLEVIDDPTANPALLRLLSGSRWRVGARDLALLGQRASQLAANAPTRRAGDDLQRALLDAVAGIDPTEVVSLAEAMQDPGSAEYSQQARARFAELAAELRELRGFRGYPLPDLLQHVLAVTGLAVEVAASAHAQASRRIESLATFTAEAAAFTDLDGTASLGSFLAYLKASVEYEGGLDAASPSSADSVKVMTIHKAKGLEWPVVYLPHLCRTVFPSTKGRSLWTRAAKVLPYPLRGDSADFATVRDWVGNKGCEAFSQAMREHDAVEERRLAYVACTRAKQQLFLSGHWWGPTQVKPRGPSDYLQEAAELCLEGVGQVSRWEQTPADDAVNPSLVSTESVAWPATPDPTSLAARLEGAALVRHMMRTVASEPAVDAPPSDEQIAGWDADLGVLLAEAAQLHSPQREVELPSSLSASSVVRLARDPSGFARDLARPMPRRPAPAARRGTRFHAWVESLFGQGELIDLDELDDAAQAQPAIDLGDLQRAFKEGPYADRSPLAVEAPFQLVFGHRVVRGRIDAVYDVGTEPGSAHEIVDWKTGSSTADPLQLAIYRLAWAELNSLPLHSVTGAVYYVSRGVVERPQQLPDRQALTDLLTGSQSYSAV